MSRRAVMVVVGGVILALGVAGWLGVRWGSGSVDEAVVRSRGKMVLDARQAKPWQVPMRRHEVAVVRTERELLDAFLREREKDPEAWLAMGMITGDVDLLREAVRRFPADARLRLRLGLMAESVDERRTVLTELLKLKPEHGLGGYLLALAEWESGEVDAAQDRLELMGSFAPLEDDGPGVLRMLTEAFRATGQTEQVAVANAAGAAEPLHLQTLDVLDQSLRGVEQLHAGARDAESVELLTAIRLGLARRLQGPKGALLSELMGVQMELSLAEGFTAEDVAKRRERESTLKRLMRSADPTDVRLPREVQAEYVRRWQAEGEVEAMEWLARVHPRQLE